MKMMYMMIIMTMLIALISYILMLISFENCSWYWHIVDVTWLSAYIFLYWINYYF